MSDTPQYTGQDLSIMQKWPLARKIQVTQTKILDLNVSYGKEGADCPKEKDNIVPEKRNTIK